MAIVQLIQLLLKWIYLRSNTKKTVRDQAKDSKSKEKSWTQYIIMIGEEIWARYLWLRCGTEKRSEEAQLGAMSSIQIKEKLREGNL